MRVLRVLWAVPVVALAMLVSGCDSEGDQEQAQEQVQGQAPLTDDQVGAFIASFPVLRAMGERYGKELAAIADPNNPNPANPYGAMMAQIKGSRGYEEFVAAVEKHGFDDMEEWSAVASRVMMAYMAITMESQSAEMKAQLDQTRKQLEADTTMPPEQKKMLLQQLEASAGMMTGLNVSEADKAAIRPRLGELERVMNQP